MLAILFSWKSMELLQNGVATHFSVTPLFSMRTELLASLQSCRSVDTDVWCKRALSNSRCIKCFDLFPHRMEEYYNLQESPSLTSLMRNTLWISVFPDASHSFSYLQVVGMDCCPSLGLFATVAKDECLKVPF